MVLNSDDRLTIHYLLRTHCDLSELRYLCFGLELDFEEIPGETKSDKIRELILFCERSGRIFQLLDRCKEFRPAVDWPDIVLTEASELQSQGDQPNLADGIYLTRFLQLEPGVATIWIMTQGTAQYYLDSIKLKYKAGVYGPVPYSTVTMVPDANYEFRVDRNTDRVDALEPAITIGPMTRQVTSFKISLKNIIGEVSSFRDIFMDLQYHSDDGRSGTLPLRKPGVIGTKLIEILKQNILIATLLEENPYSGEKTFLTEIVTPHYLQFGVDKKSTPKFQYYPLYLLGSGWSITDISRQMLEEKRQELGRILATRKELNETLARGNHIETLFNMATDTAERKIFAVDLLGGLANEESTRLLIEWLEETQSIRALLGLCFRHLAAKDGFLADYVLRNKSLFIEGEFRYHDTSNLVTQTLTIEPRGKWLEAVMALKNSPSLLKLFLIVMKEDLSEDEIRYFRDSPMGPYKTGLFIRGTMNSWEVDSREEFNFEYIGNWIYQATIELENDLHELKIADEHWSADTNWGAETAEQRIMLGEPFFLHTHWASNNIILDLRNIDSGAFQLTLDFSDISKPTLMVKKTN